MRGRVRRWPRHHGRTAADPDGRRATRAARGPTGLVAAFGLEIVEDAPRRAAHTAMAVQKAVERARAEGGGVAVRLAIEVRRLPVGVGAGTATIDADARREAWAHLDTLL